VELVPLRAVPCKTLGCNLYAGHDGPCSNAVSGKRARVPNRRIDQPTKTPTPKV